MRTGTKIGIGCATLLAVGVAFLTSAPKLIKVNDGNTRRTYTAKKHPRN